MWFSPRSDLRDPAFRGEPTFARSPILAFSPITVIYWPICAYFRSLAPSKQQSSRSPLTPFSLSFFSFLSFSSPRYPARLRVSAVSRILPRPPIPVTDFENISKHLIKNGLTRELPEPGGRFSTSLDYHGIVSARLRGCRRGPNFCGTEGWPHRSMRFPTAKPFVSNELSPIFRIDRCGRAVTATIR
jgi:hypothetical protein